MIVRIKVAIDAHNTTYEDVQSVVERMLDDLAREHGWTVGDTVYE